MRTIKEDWIKKVGTNSIDLVNIEILKLSMNKGEINTETVNKSYQKILQKLNIGRARHDSSFEIKNGNTK